MRMRNTNLKKETKTPQKEGEKKTSTLENEAQPTQQCLHNVEASG